MHDFIFSDDHIHYIAKYQTPKEHRHFAKHLLLAIDGDLHCTINGETVVGRGICIASNANHTAAADAGKLLVVLIEESSAFSARLDALLQGAAFSILENTLTDQVLAAYQKKGLQGAETCLAAAFSLASREAGQYDQRIRDVLAVIQGRECLDETIFPDLSAQANLSQSRLSHLFREQVGTALASYIVLKKMQKTAEYVLAGESLTKASHHAGFSSSAHMAATCKRMFGISLSEFFTKE